VAPELHVILRGKTGRTLTPDLITFEEFELDCARYELRRRGRALKLEKIPMELLMLLATAEGRLVSREEIEERLWGNGLFVDAEHGINTAVRKIRQVFEDDPEHPRFVQTVPRKGYRFIARVTRTHETGNDGTQNGRASVLTPDTELIPKSLVEVVIEGANQAASPVRRPSRRLGWIGIAVALSFVWPVYNFVWPRFEHHGAQSAAIRSVAVLPLENISGDASEEHFADGMTDELIAMLAKYRSLRVISRTSVMQYKKVRRPLPEIARELGADGIVEGSVVRSKDRVRVTSRLVYAPTDTHLWAETFDRPVGDVLSLQQELSQRIAERVELASSSPGRLQAVGPEPDAYVAYLKGRYFVNNERSVEGVRKSIEYASQAVQIDPKWALAWAGLSVSYLSATSVGALPAEEGFPQAKQAAQKALQLDPNLPEGHVVLGEVLENLDFDYLGAEREFRRAIELSPSDSYGHQTYADLLATLGRGDEAILEIQLAHQLDPMSFWVSRDVGRMFYGARRYDEAIAALRAAAEINPNSSVVYNWLSWCYDQKGMIPESVEMDLRDEAANGASQEKLAQLRAAFEKSGQKGYLRKKLDLGEEDAYALAQINARLGNRDEAFRWLDKAYEQRIAFGLLKVDPELDSLRSDTRFQAHLRRVNLLK